MASYRYELGINWIAVDEGNLPQLQCGLILIEDGSETVATPYEFVKGDDVSFFVVDITAKDDGAQGDTQILNSVDLRFRRAVLDQTANSPFSAEAFSAENVTDKMVRYSPYYRGNFDTFDADIGEKIVNDGRFMLSAEVKATTQGGLSRTWRVDPEMEVGGGG